MTRTMCGLISFIYLFWIRILLFVIYGEINKTRTFLCTMPLHSTNSNFFTNSKFLRHLPLGDLYKSFIFLSWSLSIIHMVAYLKKHKNHLSAIIASMLKTFYAENSEQFLMRKQQTVLLNAKNRFYEYSKQIWIYSKCKDQIWLEPQNRNGSRPTKPEQ